MRALTVELGEAIETLKISESLSTSWAHAIAQHCTGLRSFSFQSGLDYLPVAAFAVLMAARGPDLDNLCMCFLSSEHMVSALTHCTGLRCLKIWYPRGSLSFESLWKAVNIYLQELEIKCFEDPVMFAFSLLCSNCPNILHLSFQVAHPNWDKAIEAICECCGSGMAGLQLSSSSIGAERLGRICAACPNMHIDFEDNIAHYGRRSESRSADIVLALGPVARAWTLRDSDLNKKDKFTQVGVSCPNLQKIAVSVTDSLAEESFLNFCAVTRPLLRKVFIDCSSVSCTGSALQVLAGKVSLHFFAFEGQVLPLGHFRRFLLFQQELRKIELRCKGWCSCQLLQERPAHLLEAHGQDMGLLWGEIVSACVESPTSVDVECVFLRLVEEQEEMEDFLFVSNEAKVMAEGLARELPTVRGRTVSISVRGACAVASMASRYDLQSKCDLQLSLVHEHPPMQLPSSTCCSFGGGKSLAMEQ